MKTSFSAQQLADPAIAEADHIIRSCVRHGFCPQTCPTYVLLGDENDSPRGRIDLIRAMLERGGAPDAKTVRHIDQCLSCLSCETTCAARVEYRHLVDRGRAHIQSHFRRALPERLLRFLLAQVLPFPARLRAALWLGRLARPFRRFLPGRLGVLADLMPVDAPATASRRGRRVLPAEGPRRLRVALLTGCVQQVMGNPINEATIRVLRRHGCEVVLTDSGCCGALTLHLGREESARVSARDCIAAWSDEQARGGLDAIVINTSGCGTTVKDYGRLFERDPVWRARAAAIGGLARDISEVLAELGIEPRPERPAIPIAYHDACSLQHGQRVTQAPRALLKQAGFVVCEVPERHFCCGSAGTYNLLQPAIAARLGQRKARAAEASGGVAVAAGNLGCMVQIGRYTDRPLVHTVELLDWATGGPRPPALEALDLSVFPAAVAAAQAPAVAATDEINFWLYAPTAASQWEANHA